MTVPALIPEGERLDRYIVRQGWAGSRRAARELIALGAVSLNGHRSPKGAAVNPGDRVELILPENQAITPNSEVTLELLFQDESILVVNKPGLLPCHPLRRGERDTMMNAVVAAFPETASAGENAREGGLVHRLDNGTSGAILVARTAQALRAAREALHSGGIGRRYLALVSGRVESELRLDAPIAHHRRNSRKMAVAAGAARGRARPALTLIKPVRRVGEFTLVQVTPRTGNRHQIRIHLAAAGFPIAGDELYGGTNFDSLTKGRFWLHLEQLDFESAASGRTRVMASIPPDLQGALIEAAGMANPKVPGMSG